jgi:hypothetical protein
MESSVRSIEPAFGLGYEVGDDRQVIGRAPAQAGQMAAKRALWPATFEHHPVEREDRPPARKRARRARHRAQLAQPRERRPAGAPLVQITEQRTSCRPHWSQEMAQRSRLAQTMPGAQIQMGVDDLPADAAPIAHQYRDGASGFAAVIGEAPLLDVLHGQPAQYGVAIPAFALEQRRPLDAGHAKPRREPLGLIGARARAARFDLLEPDQIGLDLLDHRRNPPDVLPAVGPDRPVDVVAREAQHATNLVLEIQRIYPARIPATGHAERLVATHCRTIRPDIEPSVDHRLLNHAEQGPFARDTFQRMHALVTERDPGAHNEIFNCTGHENAV